MQDETRQAGAGKSTGVNTPDGARTGILIILDGFGVNHDADTRFNAVAQAKTPTLDRLFKTYAHTELNASEHFVGLPAGFMGNSEVGHLNIGAGRIVYQDFSLISRAIEDESFYHNPAFLSLFENMKKPPGNGTLHLIGLVSDGGVHSHISHLFALIQLAKRNGIKHVDIHAITDGRDTPPTNGVQYLKQLESYCRDAGLGTIVTVTGRFYAMDRDNRWERVAAAFDAIVGGEAEHVFTESTAYVSREYDRNVTDEFLPPARLQSYKGMKDGDGVIFFNFRADRARELTRAINQADFKEFPRKRVPRLAGYVCMTPYDESFGLPVAYEKPKIQDTLGEVISRLHKPQLRIAETEKYAHVTYFFNGGEEKVFPGEKRVLIPSPREVKTYDLKPEMSARQVTERLLSELDQNHFPFVVVNFANPDMVGHTGNMKAAVQAVEVVDECLGRIMQWVESHDAFAILTADHGNCEVMRDAEGRPLTSHTTLPVPFIIIDPKRRELRLTPGGRLCDIAPTMLSLWGIAQPATMTGHNLLA